MMKFLKRNRQLGGRFISFTGEQYDATKAKPELTWQQCDAMDEGTDFTAAMSSSSLEGSDSCNDNASTANDSERPAWLKRPMFADICSNHAMVNAERQWGNSRVAPLKRSRELDDLARAHAEEMAAASYTSRVDPTDLISKLTTKPTVRLGLNVAKGRKSVRELHNKMKNHGSNYANMLDDRFQFFGVGTCKKNGEVFICQIYLG
jgi:Cysteine-rich secretory protein family